ncbi:MAG: PadR family transcriptional regulator [Myxococcaceae bacterium]|nr:PadR family transcriptional regulator [Myxococcaceae bacterium]
MARHNTTRFAVLGALAWQPMSGYDIKKALDRSVSHFWSENFGHLYPVLRQLAAEGLVTQKREQSGRRPAKSVYRLTDRGEDELGRWLASEPGAAPRRNELLLQLFFGRRLDKTTLRDKIRRERERQVGAQATLAAVRDEIKKAHAGPDGALWLLTLRYGELMSEAAVKWCDECERWAARAR